MKRRVLRATTLNWGNSSPKIIAHKIANQNLPFWIKYVYRYFNYTLCTFLVSVYDFICVNITIYYFLFIVDFSEDLLHFSENK